MSRLKLCCLPAWSLRSRPEVFSFLALQYENPWTIPNILSLARMGLAPVLGYLIVEENFNVALGVFVLAGVTDLVCLHHFGLERLWGAGH